MESAECVLPAISHGETRKIAYQANEEEAFLIRQILAGRHDRFADLFQPHLNMLWRVVRTKMHDSPETEDVVQETLLKAFTRLSQFRFEASFRTWLIRIAINEVLQWHRNRFHSCLQIPDESSVAEAQIAQKSPSPFELCEHSEMVQSFYKALVKLPEAYQAVIRLRDLEHRSVYETARFLHLSAPGVKTRHRRARLLMRRVFPRVKSST
jgi:RNA polymerase sigma-70 factor (ECF subfamily)